MPRCWRHCLIVGVLTTSACGGGDSLQAPPPATDAIYRDFLASRTLAETLGRSSDDQPQREREQKIFQDRQALNELERSVSAKRVLLENAESKASPDQPSESLYFRLWSGPGGDGPKPMFTRLDDGGLEFQGRKIARQQALPCAVPAKVGAYAYPAFLDCVAAATLAAAK